MGIKAHDALRGLARIDATHVTVVFIKQIVDATLRDIRQCLRLGEVLPWNNNSYKRLPLNTTNTNTVWLRVNKLNRKSLYANHAQAPFFASFSITQARTKPEKPMPQMAISPLAASDRMQRMLEVAEARLPSVKKLQAPDLHRLPLASPL